jgi:mannose-6-phosphate isomerase-like protein (cupin superfamily)
LVELFVDRIAQHLLFGIILLDVLYKHKRYSGLHPGENDTQGLHSVDEVYCVIEGNGFIKLDGKDHQGTSIFVHAKAEHRFHGNKQDLVIFYALGGRT